MQGEGYCECGCGQRTPLAKRTTTREGRFKGQPLRFIRGHEGRRTPEPYEVRDRGCDTPCWVWLWSKRPSGYGQKWDPQAKRLTYAHRYYYELHRGSIPEGMDLDHLCRQRDCVNPAHLEPVTRAENIRRGDGTYLSADQVAAIRTTAATTSLTHEQIGEMFGVSKANVWSVVNNRSWIA